MHSGLLARASPSSSTSPASTGSRRRASASAAPPKVAGLGTFTVRAFAVVDPDPGRAMGACRDDERGTTGRPAPAGARPGDPRRWPGHGPPLLPLGRGDRAPRPRRAGHPGRQPPQRLRRPGAAGGRARPLPRFLAKATLWRVLPARPFLALARIIPVHRRQDHDGSASNVAMFASVVEALSQGDTVALFPEGTTHDRPTWSSCAPAWPAWPSRPSTAGDRGADRAGGHGLRGQGGAAGAGAGRVRRAGPRRRRGGPAAPGLR